MRIALVCGTNHKGSTYHIARMLADRLLEGEADSDADSDSDLTEFFLPRDFGDFCTGCASCLHTSEELCPHRSRFQPIIEVLDQADVIILASPTYVYHVTGAMKTFLDHFGYRWMLHRPAPHMFHSQVVCVTTAAGGGTRGALRDMADSAFYWGAAKVRKMGFVVRASFWKQVTPERRQKIVRSVDAMARKVRSSFERDRRTGRAHPGLRTRAYFVLSLKLHQLPTWPKIDADYWTAQGWSLTSVPWKN